MLSLAHIGLAGSFGALLVFGCSARAVSRNTPIYFIYLNIKFGNRVIAHVALTFNGINSTLDLCSAIIINI